MILNNFLTIDEVAKALKVTRQTVAKYISKNELNAIKVNKSYRVLDKDLESFLNCRSVVKQPAPIYLKKSRNCTLEYEGKTTDTGMFSKQPNGYFKATAINHNLPYNQLIFGDNLAVLNALVPDLKGKIDLIYIDPPFGTGKDFSNVSNDHAYADKLVNNEFLEFIRIRLLILKELLSDKGSIYLHIDKKIGHYIKVIMDEIFGYENFINDITRIKCNPKNFSRNAYGNYSDMILFYAKQRDKNIWNNIREGFSQEKIEKLFPKVHPKLGRYTTNPLHAPGITMDGDTGKEWHGLKPPKGRHWRYSREELTRLEELGLIEWSRSGNPRKIVFFNDHAGTKVQDVWEFKDKGLSYTDYPTQKNYDLLNRIILNSSNPDSIVLDCFAGSGGTLLTAHKLKRQWIGIDSSPHALQTIQKVFTREQVPCNYYAYIKTGNTPAF